MWVKKRLAPAGQKDGWRPQERYRAGALKWCLEIDNMLRVSTPWSGLNHLVYKPATWLASWDEWPVLTLSQDQGPDCTAGYFAFAYGKGMAVDILTDVHHGAQNDFEVAIKSIDCWPFVLLLLVVLSLALAPTPSCGRWPSKRSLPRTRASFRHTQGRC